MLRDSAVCFLAKTISVYNCSTQIHSFCEVRAAAVSQAFLRLGEKQ